MTTNVQQNPAQTPIESEIERRLASFGLVGKDLPMNKVAEALQRLVVIIPDICAGFSLPTGMSDKARKEAEEWLKKPNLGHIELLPTGLEDAKKRHIF